MPNLVWNRITVNLGLPGLDVMDVAESENEIAIHVKSHHHCMVCDGCGHVTDKVHSWWNRRVRDLPIHGKVVNLHLIQRRFRCANGCSLMVEHISGIERYTRQTKRYQLYLEGLCRHSDLSSASDKANLSYGLMDRLYYKRAMAKASDVTMQPLPKIMGIDEFSGKRGSRMHIGITDLSESPKLWDVLKTKECSAFIDHFKRYSKEDRSQVEVITHDMDRGLHRWTEIMFPKAIHVIDKFHLTRTLLKYLERVRKAAYKESSSYWNKKKIRSSYWLIKKRQDTMSETEKRKLNELFSISKQLQNGYELKEAFMKWYDQPKRRGQAEAELTILHNWFRQTKHMKRFTGTLDFWWDDILNYFARPYTNGFTEGMNNKIKTLKRKCYGFRNFDRFRIRILNECRFS
jgi:transposase